MTKKALILLLLCVLIGCSRKSTLVLVGDFTSQCSHLTNCCKESAGTQRQACELKNLSPEPYQGCPITLQAVGIPPAEFFSVFGRSVGLNFSVGKDITDRIDADFTNIPWDQALDQIYRKYDLLHIQEGNIISIYTRSVALKLSAEQRFHLDYVTK